jgi:hypothetical protein
LAFVLACGDSPATSTVADAGAFADVGAMADAGAVDDTRSVDDERVDAGKPVEGGAAADGPPVTVTPCANLPAPGQWQRISPPNSDYTTSTAAIAGTQFPPSTNAIGVRPDDPATVYVGTNQGGILRSQDCGTTWTHINTGRNGNLVDQGSPWNMIIDPAVPDIMYIVNGYGSGAWKTTNGGVDWDAPLGDFPAYFQWGFVETFAMDPTDHTHLLVAPHGSCTSMAPSPGCVGESTDSGATWRVISAPSWNEGSGFVMLDATTWLMCTGTIGNGLYLTTDRGATWNDVAPAGAGGTLPALVRGPDGAYYLTSNGGILRSTDGVAWTLIPSSPRCTPDVMTPTQFLCSDQWSLHYYTAPATNPTTFTAFAPPVGPPSGLGGVYLVYDSVHHLFYSSNFNGGLWQIVAD